MSTMNAAIYSGIEEIEVRSVKRNAPPPGYVLLETRRAGICGSDLHNYFGHWEPSYDYAQGHEFCGVVTAVGDGVENVTAGDFVTAEVASHCGTCVYCQNGDYNHCTQRQWFTGDKGHGGFAEFTTVHHSTIFKLPEGMTAEQGALVEPLAVAVRAVAQAQIHPQDRVAVIGGGTIGLLCLAVAVQSGAAETFISVKYEQQARLAQAFGADHIVNVSQTDFVESVRKKTDGLGVDAVIETIGAASTFGDALDAVRRRGRVVLVGGYYEPLSVDLGKIVNKEPILTGSNCYAYSNLRKDFDTAIALIQSGAVDPTQIVTHRYPLAEIADAFRTAADKSTGAIKVHLTL